jgi:hypothetical protein
VVILAIRCLTVSAIHSDDLCELFSIAPILSEICATTEGRGINFYSRSGRHSLLWRFSVAARSEAVLRFSVEALRSTSRLAICVRNKTYFTAKTGYLLS